MNNLLRTQNFVRYFNNHDSIQHWKSIAFLSDGSQHSFHTYPKCYNNHIIINKNNKRSKGD